MNLLDLTGKTALVTGVADNIGFGWHIAKTLQAAGADVIVSCHPRVASILERYLTKSKYEDSRVLPFGSSKLFVPTAVIPCDVAFDSKESMPKDLNTQKGYTETDVSIDGLMSEVQRLKRSIDILVHSVAFSPEVTKNHLEVSREAYLSALNISSYSLVALTRAALPLMSGRKGSIIGLSYLAAERAVPFYGGGMASAKAALECDARMLAWFIGENGHRINLISAGPYNSRAARSIGDIDKMIDDTAKRSPLRKNISPQDVANASLFLSSDLSSSITAEVIHVDAGYHAMAA